MISSKNYTLPTVLSILILGLLLLAGLWLFVYGSSLEQQPLLLPAATSTPTATP